MSSGIQTQIICLKLLFKTLDMLSILICTAISGILRFPPFNRKGELSTK